MRKRRVWGGVFAVFFAAFFAAEEARAFGAISTVAINGTLVVGYVHNSPSTSDALDESDQQCVAGVRALLNDQTATGSGCDNGNEAYSVGSYVALVARDTGGGTFATGRQGTTSSAANAITFAGQLCPGTCEEVVSFQTTGTTGETGDWLVFPADTSCTPLANGLCPTAKDECIGNDVFHLTQCVLMCPTGFVDVNMGGECMIPLTDENCQDQKANADGTACVDLERADCTAMMQEFDGTTVPPSCVPCERGESFNGGSEMCEAATSQTPTCGENASLNSAGECMCNNGFNDDDGDGVCTEDETETETEMPETETTAAATDNEAHQTAAFIGGGMVVVGGLVWYLSGGSFAAVDFSPDFNYAITESGYSVNAGGRADFRKNRWHLYWTAGQESVNGDFGDFRYASGGEYKADFWTAAFSEKVSGKVADYDVSLSANYGEGVWKLSPVYRLHSRFEEEEDGGLESETTNSLNLEGVLRYHRWIVRPSAGFQWRNAEDFADNARFGISAVRNL